jgi:hypothetical protein
MIAASIDPAVHEYLRECLLDIDDMSDDPYRMALCLRTLLCERALTLRVSDPELSKRFLNAERAIADAVRTSLTGPDAASAA